MYALSFMKFTRVILNRGALLGTAAALVKKHFSSGTAESCKSGERNQSNRACGRTAINFAPCSASRRTFYYCFRPCMTLCFLASASARFAASRRGSFCNLCCAAVSLNSLRGSLLYGAVRLKFNLNIIVQRFMHKRCVQLPAGLTAPCSLRSLGNARIRPLRELYFAGSMYALSFMKFTRAILNRARLFRNCRCASKKHFSSGTAESCKSGERNQSNRA